MAGSSAGKAKERNAIAERRRQLVLLLRGGLTQAEAAEQLNCSAATISGDLATLRAQSQRETALDMAALIEQECAQLDADEAALRAHLYGIHGHVKLEAYDRIMAIQDRRARWRGFDAVPKSAGSSLAELDAALAGLGLL